jgi:HK97 family phage major capsid protein
VRQVAGQLTTGQGNSILYPTTDDTSNAGELVAEGATAANQDATFGSVTLGAYRFSSKIIPVSLELLQDSAVDIEGLIYSLITTRLGRIQNTYFTTGTGTAQPLGVLTAAAAGGSKVGAAGQTTSITYDDLVDVEHSVDPAYRSKGTCSWMFHDNTLKILKKLKDSMSRPLWRPAVTGGDAADILGYSYGVNQDMPVMAANAKSIVFGDMSRYLVRDVMGVTLYRFDDSNYMKNGQVAFLAFQRSDGKWIDSGNAAIAYYQNSAT